jgi:hypothetical protein
MTFTHTPPQLTVPVGQLQATLWQSWPAGQTLPQVPQLAGSDAVSVQLPWQEVCPVGQESRHNPPEQTSLAGQLTLQRPQCCGSLVRLAHWGGVPQETLPTGQPQTLPAQT